MHQPNRPTYVFTLTLTGTQTIRPTGPLLETYQLSNEIYSTE
jgi:hypothetical protein